MSKLGEWGSNNLTLISVIIMIAGLTLGYILFKSLEPHGMSACLFHP
ncbi:hypothetical protein ACIL2U_003813 [Vibrio alginolyticus]